jgi:hypothetical protein
MQRSDMYPHKILINDIPVPPDSVRVAFETDYGTHTSYSEYFCTTEEFLEFFKPVVQHYERLKNEQHSN